MPLVQGTDARGRPIFARPDVDPTQYNGGGVSADQLTQAVDEVDPGTSSTRAEYKSNVDYGLFTNRNDTIRGQGQFATQQAQQAAAAALQARLKASQDAATQAINAASSKLGSGQIPGGNVYVANNASSGGTDLRSRLVAKVASQKGVNYKWGGTTPRGFDCSGLVQWAYGKLGINMPRVSGQQARMGNKTSIKNLVPGDLVAHPGHIAVYAGNGMMWEAPHTGAQVRLVRVRSNMYGVHLSLPGD